MMFFIILFAVKLEGTYIFTIYFSVSCLVKFK